MNYNKIYLNFINSRKLIIYDEVIYTELHHILPKCLGGTNDDSNIIRLSYRDHYFAHLILFKKSINLNEKFRMAAALHYLTKSNNGLRPTSSRLYEINNIRFKNSMKEFYNSVPGKEYLKKRSINAVRSLTQKFKFNFWHDEHGEFAGSCYDLMKLYPTQKLNSSNLCKVGKEERSNHKGWMLFKNKSIGITGFLNIKHDKMSNSAKLRDCPSKGSIHLSHDNMRKRLVKPNSKTFNELISIGYYSKKFKISKNTINYELS